MSEKEAGQSKSFAVAKHIAARAGEVERLALINWANALLEIRSTTVPMHKKAQRAVAATFRSEVIPAILKLYGAPLKQLAWDDRSWPVRIGGIAAAATATVVSSEGAGIAALGGAIGVPLWIVIGAGGTFATVLVQELTATKTKTPEATPAPPAADIPWAEYTLLEPDPRILPNARQELQTEWESLKPALLPRRKIKPPSRFDRIRLRANAAIVGLRQRAEEKLPERRRLYVGVDGCAAGWFSLAIDSTGRSWISVDTTFASLLERWPKARHILVDIPVGLPSDANERPCDVEARRILGQRRSSVFPAPTRAAISAADYRTASTLNKQITGRGLSKQAWNICDKIRQVDDALLDNPKLVQRIREVHPEVLFWALNGKEPLRYYKKTEEGEEERLRILERCLPVVRDLYLNARSVYSRAIVAPDDILDAMAAAVTAHIADGVYESIPAETSVDERKIPVAMVYVQPSSLQATSINVKFDLQR